MKIVKPNVPNFKLAFEHFHIHAGGRSVLDELEKSLGLLPMHMEAWSLPGCLITGLGIPPAAHCGILVSKDQTKEIEVGWYPQVILSLGTNNISH
ncbi:hypothetical protein V6N11_063575 [Hibiscus sabdariffa]|uniref:Chalcone/stilbene synthase C-terminal domain-containing protein n=1 Tax=Hibiscus sabdariffa TaxID=183260 RepID=A0ABR2A9N8_9ROSI